MELTQVIERFSEGLEFVDANTTHITANRRNGEIYLPGVKTLTERQFVKELAAWWQQEKSTDFNPISSLETEVSYPGIPRANCDLVFSTDGSESSAPEWSVEVKHIALVGNNGNNNDYGVAKLLSPYLKDRSLIHDIQRMRKYGTSKKRAVIGYCFSYDSYSCEEAKKRHPNYSSYVENIERVLKVNDPLGKKYSVMPMVEFADSIFLERDLVSPVKIKEFTNAWRHPCGGKGLIFAWQVKTS